MIMNEIAVPDGLVALETLYTILAGIVAIITAGLGIQWRYYKNSKESITRKFEADLKEVQNEKEKELIDIRKEYDKGIDEFKKSYESPVKLEDDDPLIQEIKLVYAKYLHIHKSADPIYNRTIKRLDKDYDIFSEYHYYRFNKYNKENPDITLTDNSTGIVDQRILYPWQKLTFTDMPSMFQEGLVSQSVGKSDTYFSATTYYNGFQKSQEDIGAKMEIDTKKAQIIADFSSIPGFESLFIAPPDAYKWDVKGNKTKLLSLEELDYGVYLLEGYDLKKGESIMIDFHVNWEYLDQ